MKFGVTIPNNWGVENPQEVLALGPLAEELGYDSLWVMDHLFNTGYIRERLEDRPYYHPLSMLSYLSATTSKILLGTSVLVLPYHNPVELAKYAATLDQISGGRLTLGVGVGAMPEEFDALGIPMRQRGSLTDESIAIMKELWTTLTPAIRAVVGAFQTCGSRLSPSRSPTFRCGSVVPARGPSGGPLLPVTGGTPRAYPLRNLAWAAARSASRLRRPGGIRHR